MQPFLFQQTIRPHWPTQPAVCFQTMITVISLGPRPGSVPSPLSTFATQQPTSWNSIETSYTSQHTPLRRRLQFNLRPAIIRLRNHDFILDASGAALNPINQLSCPQITVCNGEHRRSPRRLTRSRNSKLANRTHQPLDLLTCERSALHGGEAF